jgi:hypothetical protein
MKTDTRRTQPTALSFPLRFFVARFDEEGLCCFKPCGMCSVLVTTSCAQHFSTRITFVCASEPFGLVALDVD